jgi:hypothetical protein
MLVIKAPLSLVEIQENHNHFFEKMVKIVVDLEQELIALDAELHADLEQHLLETAESKQENLWGANIYFSPPKLLELTSLINIRPAQGNKSMSIEDPKIQKQVQELVEKLIS